MDDYSSLAHRIAGGVADVRGCLILSRDGLILGSFPEDESVVKPSWLRFASLGEPERSFVEFAGEVWAYLRRGPYAAFAIAGIGVRPGLLLDQLEQVLMAAEEARSRRETLKVPESPASLSGKPRTSLHPPAGPFEPALAGADPRPWSRGTRPEEADLAATGEELDERGSAVAAGAKAAAGEAVGTGDGRSDDKSGAKAGPKAGGKGDAKDHRGDPKGDPRPSTADGGNERRPDASSEPSVGASATQDSKKRKKDDERAPEPVNNGDRPPASPEGGKPSDGARPGASLELEPEAEVDRVLLAKEFSGLLQVEAADDEAQS